MIDYIERGSAFRNALPRDAFAEANKARASTETPPKVIRIDYSVVLRISSQLIMKLSDTVGMSRPLIRATAVIHVVLRHP